jgi:peptide deformylase
MAQVLPIAQLGHPVLREVAQMVDAVSDPAVQDLMDNLMTTMAEKGSIGFAAPQVHQSLRTIVISSRPTPRYPDAVILKPLIMVNPELIDMAEEMAKGWEGCASIPGIRGLVPRSLHVAVE